MHQRLFKAFLTHPETARDFLSIHLPPALRELCDLDTLRLAPGSFVEESLRPYYQHPQSAGLSPAKQFYLLTA